MRRAAKRKILSGAMALAMAASVLAWAPVQAYAEGPAAVVTQTEEANPEDAAEAAVPATPETAAAPTVTDWQWVTDDDGIAQNDTLDLSKGEAAADNGIALFAAVKRPTDGYTLDYIKSKLPTQISAQKSDGSTVTLEIDTDTWASETYVRDADGNWPQYGSYVFTAQLKDGTALDENAKKLQITVCLGTDPNKTVVPDGLDLGENTADGLPNYGVRIAPDPGATFYGSKTSVWLRIKVEDPNQEVVLETYIRDANGHYSLSDRKWNYDVNIGDMTVNSGYIQPDYSYVFHNKAGEWKSVHFVIRRDDGDQYGYGQNVVYVLRTSEKSSDNIRPKAASGDVQYELYYTTYVRDAFYLNTENVDPRTDGIV